MHADGAGPGPGPEPAAGDADAHGRSPCTQGTVVERLSRYGMQVLPSAVQRRTRLQRQQEVTDGAPERGSLTPAMRKKYLKELMLGNPSAHSGLSSVLTSQPSGASADPDPQDARWALYPMEHAWMLCAVEGNYDTILDFISEDPHLLTRKDFISGYSVLHWLAKRGQDEVLVKLLRYAEDAGISVNVDVRGSGGLTPLHVACMHRSYMVVKLLVGAFGASVEAMDYGGRRAWQYLGGDAPPELRELLGTWDEEHRGGPPQNLNNNNCATATNSCEEPDQGLGDSDEVDFFSRTMISRTSWRFGSIRKLLPSLSFTGNKNQGKPSNMS